MATYVIAEAEYRYCVVFSLAELDSGILESEVIVADTMDGAPLVAQQGHFDCWRRIRSDLHAGSEC
jgi:hypothetical protein